MVRSDNVPLFPSFCPNPTGPGRGYDLFTSPGTEPQ